MIARVIARAVAGVVARAAARDFPAGNNHPRFRQQSLRVSAVCPPCGGAVIAGDHNWFLRSGREMDAEIAPEMCASEFDLPRKSSATGRVPCVRATARSHHLTKGV